MQNDVKKGLAEGIGTFVLVFFGTGAIVVDQLTLGSLGQLGIAFSFGTSVALMIYVFGKISGAHINPAVSIGFSLNDQLKTRELLYYILFQLGGAILASIFLFLLFPEASTFGETLPQNKWWQSFILEGLMSFLLMFVILLVSSQKSIQHFTGLAVGGTVFLEALVFGPITGASMNPARSLAPALVSGEFSFLWIYIVAPILGCLFATYVTSMFKD